MYEGGGKTNQWSYCYIYVQHLAALAPSQMFYISAWILYTEGDQGMDWTSGVVY